jgi:HEAT repeat protein
VVEGARQKVVKALAGLLGRGVDLQVREFAALALGKTGSVAAAGPLLEALDSNVSRNLKVFAALGLGFLGDQSHAGAIREYLRSNYEYNQKGGMCVALGFLGDQGSIPYLESLLKNQMPVRIRMLSRLVVAPDLRGYAAVALALLGVKELAPVMRDELRKNPGDVDLGRAFSLAIGVLGCPDAAPVLLTVLRKASIPSVKGSAAVGLGYLRDPTSVKPLLEMLGDGAEPVANRIYAALALGVLGQGPNGGALAKIALDYDYRIHVGALDEVLGIF